jgi:hypothetical protein
VVPGLEPVLVAGPLVAAIIGGMESAIVVGGLRSIGAGLLSIGVPKNSFLNYETAIKVGRYVVVAHGDESEVDRPRRILGTMQSESATAPTA